MNEWNWLTKAAVLLIHDLQLSIHGGLPGVRDEALLESALARPQNLAAYGSPDAAELAASYAFGIARNHPFVDGNKRTAFVAAMTFLGDNTKPPFFEESDVVATVLRLAAGELSETELAAWFRANTQTGLHEEAAAYRAGPGRKQRKKRTAKRRREPVRAVKARGKAKATAKVKTKAKSKPKKPKKKA
ncbi:MAG: type II toxin-antitoxin system death-on-curing family toxin [Rhodospirillaceae bacterium]|nr:type II toxin-antitoxin system death-on-curing family toxin [Rhodospirillaceae bacterium]